MELPPLRKVLWWSLTGRCVRCGDHRRTDVATTRCWVHYGMWKRCVRCETWHKDNEECPRVNNERGGRP